MTKKIDKSISWLFCENLILRELVNNKGILSGKNKLNQFNLKYKISVSYILLFIIYLYSKLIKKNIIKNQNINLVFLIPEGKKELFFFEKKLNKNLHYVDAYSKKDPLSLTNFSFFKFFSHANKITSLVNKYLTQNTFSEKISSLMPIKLERRILNFVIFTYIFSMLKKNNKEKSINILTFGSLLISHASIFENLDTTYYAHGLLGKNFYKAYPEFSKIYVYSDYEKNYLIDKLNKNNIFTYQFPLIKKHKKNIIVFSRKFMSDDDNKILHSILTYFNNNDFKIYIKKHPRSDNKENLKQYKKFNFSELSKNDDTKEVISKLKPMFTIQWYSTTLAESLNSNIIPICLADYDELRLKNTYVKTLDWIIYPIENKCLNWRYQQDLIIKNSTSLTDYMATITKLKDYD